MKNSIGLKVIAVVPAAGSGVRMGKAAGDKPFLEIQGRPVLVETLSRLDASNVVDRIVVVAKENCVARVEKLVSHYGIQKVTDVIAGGATRTGSVSRALGMLGAEAEDIILIHDGVRPFVTDDIIARSVAAAIETGAAVTAIPCTSTIKRSDDGLTVNGTLDRKLLWEAQTPQAFRAGIIQQAYELAGEDGATDDSALVERTGRGVAVVPGDRRNIKVTVPGDLEIASAILASMEER